MQNLEITKKQINENIIQIFVPLQIRKRGGAAMLIISMPASIGAIIVDSIDKE